jgi:hypothetical protein
MAASSATEIGSIVGWAFAFIGVVSTLVGWRVRGQQQIAIAKRKDINDSIDRAVKALSELEDCVLSFWTEKDTKFTQNHVRILLRRLIVNFNQITELNDKPQPSQLLIELRKNITLDFESAKRPISAKSQRVANIAMSSSRLLNSSYLMKSWKHEI